MPRPRVYFPAHLRHGYHVNKNVRFMGVRPPNTRRLMFQRPGAEYAFNDTRTLPSRLAS